MKTNQDKTTLTRYAALDAWLEKNHARFLWSAGPHGGKQGKVEVYRVGNHVALVHRLEHGWDIFTSHDGNDIAATLADAERRLGIAQPSAGEPEFRGNDSETYYRAPSGQWWCVQSPDLDATGGAPTRVSEPPASTVKLSERDCFDLDVSGCA